MIQTALSAGVIDFEDAFRVRGIKNIKLAEMYLTKAKKYKYEQDMEKAQQNSEMNARAQQESIQTKAQMDAQLEQLQGQNKMSVVAAELKLKQQLSEQEFVQMALMKSFELSKPLTEEMSQIVNTFFIKKQQEQMQEQMMQQQQQEAAKPEDQQRAEQTDRAIDSTMEHQYEGQQESNQEQPTENQQ
jgi:hypothetical protein